MRVILATPPYDLIGAGYGSFFKIKSGFLPPLGIGYVAASLLQAGHDVEIVDSSPLFGAAEDACQFILSRRPDVVGLSAMSTNAPQAYDLAHCLRSASSVPIILGGPHSTTFPRKTMEDCSAINAVVMGEGENTAVELLAGLRGEGVFRAVAGSMVRRKDGSIADGGTRLPVKDLDVLPMPARQLYQNRLYHPLPNQSLRRPATSMMSSRGCPWGRCKFCYKGCRSAYRRHSPERVFQEMAWVARDFGVKEVAFWDDVFAVNESWILRFCSLLQEAKLDLVWSCYGRADTVTAPMLKRMGETGCHSLYIGFESAYQEILDLCGKGIRIEQVRNAVKWAHDAGIDVRGSFMIGLPGETPEMGRQAARFAAELDLEFPQFLPYHPIYGTELADECAAYGHVGDIMSYKGGAHGVTYAPFAYGNFDAVKAVCSWNYLHFYFRWRYFVKHLKRIRSLSDLKRYLEGFLLWVGLLLTMLRK